MLGARQADIIALEDDSCSQIPLEARQGAAHMARWIHTLFDPQTLADEAREALAEVAPFVSLSPRQRLCAWCAGKEDPQRYVNNEAAKSQAHVRVLPEEAFTSTQALAVTQDWPCQSYYNWKPSQCID